MVAVDGKALAPHNATIIQPLALNLLEQTKTRHAMRVKRKAAGGDNAILPSVLAAA
ncbi:MAG: hypothetical protein ACT4P2_09420 [Pseudomonadota bacterium]